MGKEEAKKKSRDLRGDLWTFVVFVPDGVVWDDDYWKFYAEQFDALGLSWWAMSPQHNQDYHLVDGGDEFSTWKAGDAKKNHLHAVWYFGENSRASRRQVLDMIQGFGGVRLQKGNSARSLCRYFIHLDHPGKAQYSAGDCHWAGEVDFNAFFLPLEKPLTSEERVKLLGEISEYVDREGFIEFDDFETFCRQSNWDWFKLIATSGREHIRHKINSKRYKAERASAGRAHNQS